MLLLFFEYRLSYLAYSNIKNKINTDTNCPKQLDVLIRIQTPVRYCKILGKI